MEDHQQQRQVHGNAAAPNLGDMKSANFPMDDEGRTLHLQWRKGDVVNRLILVGSADRARLFATQGLNAATMEEHGSSRGFLAFTGFPKNHPKTKVSIIAVGMGAPMMDFVIREVRAIVSGPLIVVRVGTCGTPCEDVEPGTFVQCYPGSYHCSRNVDAWSTPGQPPYYISKMIPSEEALSKAIFDACMNSLTLTQRCQIIQGKNCSADSFYSSQGRLDINFCDRNADLLQWINAQHDNGVKSVEMETFHLLDLSRCASSQMPIYATAISLVLANRSTDDYLPMEDYHMNMSIIGNIIIDAMATFPMPQSQRQPTPEQLSLWLVPDYGDEVARNLQECIREMMKSHYQGSRDEFLPHILLGSLSKVSNVEAALHNIHLLIQQYRKHSVPCTVTLSEVVSQSNTFYESIYVDLKLEGFLDSLRSLVMKNLTGASQTPFQPHIPLFYGEVNPKDQEKTISTSLEKGRNQLAGCTLNFPRLQVVDTTSSRYEDWVVLQEFIIDLAA